MADIDVPEIFEQMLVAAKGVFAERWPNVKDFAESELDKLARTLAQIGKLIATEQITEGEASILLEMQKNTARAVILTLEGLGLLLVEEALSAALNIVKDTVNTILGFSLI